MTVTLILKPRPITRPDMTERIVIQNVWKIDDKNPHGYRTYHALGGQQAWLRELIYKETVEK